MRILLDTNILLRNFNQADPEYPVVARALSRLVATGWRTCVASQGLYVFWVVATRPTPVNGLDLPAKAVRAHVEDILQAHLLIPDVSSAIPRWLELCSSYGVRGRPAHDARLVALMIEQGLTYLLTLNVADFARFKEITVLTPSQVVSTDGGSSPGAGLAT